MNVEKSMDSPTDIEMANGTMDESILIEYPILQHIGNGVYANVQKQGNQKVLSEIEKASATILSNELLIDQEIEVTRYMVMERLGSSLGALHTGFSQRPPWQTLCFLIDQMLDRIECLHEQSFIHSDLRPHSFYIGQGENHNKAYLIDFGVSQQYVINQQHIPFQEGCKPSGTPAYLSLNVHRGFQSSRRDDIESMGYIFLQLCMGTLPWHIYDPKDPSVANRIYEMKLLTPINELCAGLPVAFALFLKYSRSLNYDEKPNYLLMRLLFRGLLTTLIEPQHIHFDWSPVKTELEQTLPFAENNNGSTIHYYEYIDLPSVFEVLKLTKGLSREGDFGNQMEDSIRAYIIRNTSLLKSIEDYIFVVENIYNSLIDEETNE